MTSCCAGSSSVRPALGMELFDKNFIREKGDPGGWGAMAPQAAMFPIENNGFKKLFTRKDQYTLFFYKEPVYKEPTCRRPKYKKNVYY